MSPASRLALALVLAGACSDDGPAVKCPIGDRTQPIELAAVAYDHDRDAVIDLADGATIDLFRPQQGGKVVYAGVKARNVDGCAVDLTAALRDPGGNQVIALEGRPTRLTAQADGWGWPTDPFNQLANLPACPNAAAARDVDGNRWTLELRLDEHGGRTATITLGVVPRCAVPDEAVECACECDSDFVIGGQCPTDPPLDAGVR